MSRGDETTGLFRTKPADRAAKRASFPLRLVVVKGNDLGRRYIVEGPASIGRSTSNDVVVEDSFVSRSQAAIFASAEGAHIRHLSQRSQTTVNGAPIDEYQLAWGDKLEMGATVLMVTPHDAGDAEKIERQRAESLGHLASGIAHDFNNMLGVMVATLGYLREVGSRPLDEQDVRECLDDLDAAVDRSSELVARILGFIRREQEKHVAFDFGALVSEVVTLSTRAFPRSIRVHTDIGERLRVRGARAQLAQVLMNMLINARDAMPNGGTVTVVAAHDKASVTLRVADTGTGMDAETKQRIFDPLFSTKGDAGTGLGLAMVADVVRWHGGSIDVESELGRGTELTLRLPRSDASTSSRERRPTAKLRLPTMRRLIMIVDDDVVVRRSLARVLKRDHDVIEVDQAILAAPMFERKRPDLVLLDLDMTGLSGRDVWFQLQQLEHVAPIAFVTGDAHGVASLARAEIPVLEKPFTVAKLRSFVDEVLNAP